MQRNVCSAHALRVAAVSGLLAGLSACASAPPPRLAVGRTPAYNRPYEVHGRWYRPVSQPHYDVVGLASWYSYETPARTTADGERFDARIATAAHTTLPLPSWLEVTNLENGRRVRVRLNDRGPFAPGRLIDLSPAAALQLGYLNRGVTRVRVRYLGPAAGPLRPADRYAELEPDAAILQPTAADTPADR